MSPGGRGERRCRARAVTRLEASVLGSPLGEGGLRDGRWVSLAERRPDRSSSSTRFATFDLDPSRLGLWSKQKVWWRCRSCGASGCSTVCGRAGRGAQCPSRGPRVNAGRKAGHSHRGGFKRTSQHFPQSLQVVLSGRRVKKGPGRRPLSTKRRRLMELRAGGWSTRGAAREVGVSSSAPGNWTRGYTVYRHGMAVRFVEPLDRLEVCQISARYLSQ